MRVLYYSTYCIMALKQATLLTVVVLLLVMPLAQPLELVYKSRSGNRPGDNRIFLQCRGNNTLSVPNPQIWVEWSDLPRQRANFSFQGQQVAIAITQHLEGNYSCSYSGMSSNALKLVGKESCYQVHDYHSK